MANPPTDIPASELWLKLQEMPRPHIVVDFPRKGLDGEPICQVGMWVLTQEEQVAAAATATKSTKNLLKELTLVQGEQSRGYEDVYGNEAAVEVLFRACRHPEDVKRPFFPNSAAVRKLSVDEVGVLMNFYYEAQAKLGPIVSYMTDDEYEIWVKRLAEGASTFPLEHLSSALRNELMLRMALHLSTFLMANSSAGSPPSDTLNETVQPSE
jgi:hypothetical protein